MTPQTLNAVLGFKRQTGKKLLSFDYDGTLAPPVVKINDKTLSKTVSDHLNRLLKNEDYVIAIVSGRNIATLHNFLGERKHLIYAGDHGVEIEQNSYYFLHPQARASCEVLPDIVAKLNERLLPFEGVEYELKTYSATVVFKRLKASLVAEIESIIYQTVNEFPSLKLIPSKFVYEICPNIQWNKGYAIEKIANDFSILKENVFFIGDEANDELAFQHLPEALTVRVGAAPTVAKYLMSKQSSIEDLLTVL